MSEFITSTATVSNIAGFTAEITEILARPVFFAVIKPFSSTVAVFSSSLA